MENECIKINYSNGSMTISIPQFFPSKKKDLKQLLTVIGLEKHSTPEEKKQELIDKLTKYYQSYIDTAIIYIGFITQQQKNIDELSQNTVLSKAEKTALKTALRICNNYNRKLAQNQKTQDHLRKNITDLLAF